MLLQDWNATGVAYPGDRLIHHLFEEQAERTPDATAVVFEGRPLTYGELNARANRLARHLRGLGLGSDARVGVLLERSLEMVVALLAVLKAGAAYVPIDPEYPRERVAFMLADASRPRPAHAAASAPEPAGARGGRGRGGRRRAGLRRPVGAEPALGSLAAEPRLRHLHVGFDRQTQGRDDYAGQPPQPHALDGGELSARGGGLRVAEDAVQLRRLGLGVLRSAAGGCATGDGATRGAPRPGVSGGGDGGAGGDGAAGGADAVAGVGRDRGA